MKTPAGLLRGAKAASLVSICSGGLGASVVVMGANVFTIPGFWFGLSCLVGTVCGWVSWNTHKVGRNLIEMSQDSQVQTSQDNIWAQRYMLRGTFGLDWLIG